jgi:hypothetical protein
MGMAIITPSFAAAGSLLGIVGATGWFLSWYSLIAVKIATPPNMMVATTISIVVR